MDTESIKQPATEDRGDLVSLRELNHHAGQVISRVRNGASVIVTDRGQAVARIIPHEDAEDRLAELIGQGRATPARGTYRRPEVRLSMPDSVTTDMLLAEDREDREDER